MVGPRWADRRPRPLVEVNRPSDVDLLRNLDRIIRFDAEAADDAFDLPTLQPRCLDIWISLYLDLRRQAAAAHNDWERRARSAVNQHKIGEVQQPFQLRILLLFDPCFTQQRCDPFIVI